jgi:phosphoglycerate dehydrogenase-like enzyme
MAILMHTSKPKILIPEKVSPDGLALLKDQFEVHERKGLSPEELQNIIGEYEALIIRSETQVTAKLLNATKKLKVVARAGVGVDNVDVQSATTHGIIVVNSPAGNINAAAEHTIARAYSKLPDHMPLLMRLSTDGSGPKRRRRSAKHQGGQVGAKSSCRCRGERQDTGYCWVGER